MSSTHALLVEQNDDQNNTESAVVASANALLRKRARLEEARNEASSLKGMADIVHRELVDASKRVKTLLRKPEFQSLAVDFDALIDKSKAVVDAQNEHLRATDNEYNVVFDESQACVDELRRRYECIEVLQFIPSRVAFMD